MQENFEGEIIIAFFLVLNKNCSKNSGVSIKGKYHHAIFP